MRFLHHAPIIAAMDNNNEVPELVSSAEIRKLFGISLNTLYKWRRAGMPVIQPGGRSGKFYFNKADVMDWARGRAQGGVEK